MVCDTDTEFLDKLAAVLHEQFDPCTVEYLYGPSALEVSLRSDSGGADILLTEIELRGQSAIPIIAHCLRESSPLQVIYMTQKIEYCTEVYDTRHCGFLLKPVRFQELARNIRRALRLLEQRKKCGIVVRKNGSVHLVNAPSLLYVESRGRLVRVVTQAEVLETYDRITNFLYQLDKRFLQCHKSYVVNMEQVKKFCGDSFIMENGASVPISQSRRKAVRQQFLSYIGSAET